jgi:hypothetical protein
MFERLVWQSDRVLLDDLVFRIEHYRSASWDGGDHFRFYKIKELVDQYANFFSYRKDFRPNRIIELGIFDGGSTAFWFELFNPTKHVAIDIQDQTDTRYFQRYLDSRGIRERVQTYWKTDQADKAALQKIVEKEFDDPLDLVIDDASHLYNETKTSFHILFPLLKPGGLYIIEDWAWGHWPDCIRPGHPWVSQIPLTRLILELIEATGTTTQLISSIAVYQGFTAVERGPKEIGKSELFRLDGYIVRHPHPRYVGDPGNLGKNDEL